MNQPDVKPPPVLVNPRTLPPGVTVDAFVAAYNFDYQHVRKVLSGLRTPSLLIVLLAVELGGPDAQVESFVATTPHVKRPRPRIRRDGLKERICKGYGAGSIPGARRLRLCLAMGIRLTELDAAMFGSESGPSVAAALRMAEHLGCKVEDLFSLCPDEYVIHGPDHVWGASKFRPNGEAPSPSPIYDRTR